MLYLNDIQVPVTMFPDKTAQVWKLPTSITDQLIKDRPCYVKWVFEHEGEFMHLAQLKMLLNTYPTRPRLELTYLPYGRQDKDVSNETTFALLSFANLLNSLYFEEVLVIDPHSEVALVVIDNFRAAYPLSQLEHTLIATDTDMVCYPDKGAVSKYSKEYKSLVGECYIYGEKVRDQLTGNITNYQVIGNCEGKSVLIVDDICDGGMTFKILAKDLLAGGAKEINLFVTHGIFSRGLKTLHESGIKRIFTHDGEKSE